MKSLLLAVLFGCGLLAQAQVATHTVTATWIDTSNPATGTTYTVYRSTGLCSGTPTFAKLATGIATKTYVDSTATPGNYCYEITATFNAIESSPSNTSAAAVGPFAPTGLTLQVAMLDVTVPADPNDPIVSLLAGGFLTAL